MKRKSRCLIHLILFIMLLSLSFLGIMTAAPERRTATEPSPAVMHPEKKRPVADSTADELDLAMAKIRQQRRIAEEEKRSEAQQLDMAWYPGKDIVKGGSRFTVFHDGTVMDARANPMWAAKDNGREIYWASTKSYCTNCRGGGFTDWRMSMQDELAGLYGESKTYKSFCGKDVPLTELVNLTCMDPWASETRGSEAAYFFFTHGLRYWGPLVERLQHPDTPGAFWQIDYLVIWFFDYFLFPDPKRSLDRYKKYEP